MSRRGKSSIWFDRQRAGLIDGKGRWRVWLLPVVGLAALVWFLVRVIPKPSRVTYPCQQVAAPLAGGFVVWLAGIVGMAFVYRKAKDLFRRSRVAMAFGCLGIAAGLGLTVLINMPERAAVGAAPNPNAPIGVAKGIHPGRVVWSHDPDATDWDGPGDGHWWESTHTDQNVVDAMMSQVLRALSGEATDAAAWDAIFRHQNQAHGKGNVGYQPGEKIAIKVNFVGCIKWANWGNCDPMTHDLKGIKDDYMNTSPQAMLALLRQLVYSAGVAEADISIGDPVCYWADPYFDPLNNEFPGVHYKENNAGQPLEGREYVRFADGQSGRPYAPLYWSCHPTGYTQDFMPVYYAEADYFINLANLKAHDTDAGVTMCGKNHYGTLNRVPIETGYYSLHDSLPTPVSTSGNYRAIVDLSGHADTGGKLLLCLIDALWSGRHPNGTAPIKWFTCPPWNTTGPDWTSSLFASLDPVAIDSVGFDFLYTEWTEAQGPHMAGADDYMHEMALADGPPSGTFYDPNNSGDVQRLGSLGVHEHWNNPVDKKYSRNLSTGDGIEFIPIGPPSAMIDASPTQGLVPLAVSFDGSGSMDVDGTIVSYEWDFDGDGTIDSTDMTTSHVYTASEVYEASLTVTDDVGLSDTKRVTITVGHKPGDYDDDQDVDQADFGAFQACLGVMQASTTPPCEDKDLTGDNIVNGEDESRFEGCMSGANVPSAPDCLD